MYADTAPESNNERHKTGQIMKSVRIYRTSCPSCGHESSFTPAGVQKVPKAIAEATGLPQVIRMYHCDTCKSTLSDQDLTF